MNKKDLVRIIREVVRKEVKSQINNVLTEMESKPTNKTSLNEAITSTSSYPTMKTFSAADARAGFAAMQDPTSIKPKHTDIQGNQVDLASLGQGLDKALTRDYSQIVKKFNK